MHRSSFYALAGALALLTSCSGNPEDALASRHVETASDALTTTLHTTFVGWGGNASGQSTPLPDVRDASAIAAGAAHTIALKQDGTVVAWGSDTGGAITLPQGLTGVTAIAAGWYHNVALRNDRTVVAWGYDNYGQARVPAGLSGVAAVAAGSSHSVALKKDGTVVAWGNPTSCQTCVPAGLSGVVAIAAGASHTVALRSDGTVAAWGDNSGGQTNVPTGLSGVVAIAGGTYHTIALKNDGTVVAWGLNGVGQTTVPAGLSGVRAIAAGVYHNFALRNDGTVVAWGGNTDGQLDVPATLSNVVAIAAGSYHSVALKSDGTVVAWGKNAAGQAKVPAGLSGAAVVAAGGTEFTLALKGDGTVAAWGNNNYGQTNVPAGLVGVTGIAAGLRHALTVRNDGTVVAWGENGYGQTTVPAGLSNAVAVAAGWYHSLALKQDGTVIGWGDDGFQQATPPVGLSGVTAVAAGGYYSAALRNDGTVVVWGSSSFGQAAVPATATGVTAIATGKSHVLALRSDGTVIGWGDTGFGKATPPAGLSDVVAVAAGDNHSLALKGDGTVVAWGYNDAGQTTVPAGVSDVIAIAAGVNHSVALQLPKWEVLVKFPGQGTGTVRGDGGIDCTPASSAGCWASFPAGSQVTLTATADPGSRFLGWSEACTNTEGDCLVTVDGDTSVLAIFEPELASSYELELWFAGSGYGTLWTDHMGCSHVPGSGGFCLDTAAPGETLTIEAAPDANMHFTGWSGACHGTAPSCAVLMDGPKSVSGTFEPGPTYALTVRASGGNGGTVTGPYGIHPMSVGPVVSWTVHVPVTAPATSVTLTAAPAPGSFISSWSGCTTVSADKRTCTVPMSYAKTVSVAFQPTHYVVTARTAGTAKGTISSSDTEPAISCPSSSSPYAAVAANGSTVTLIATPDEDAIVTGWTGCTSFSADKRICTATMTMARTLVATFQPARYPVTARTTGLYGAAQGTITSAGTDPAIACAANMGTCVSSAPNGATVTLTADVPAGSLLASWTGCTSVSADKRTCTVSMTSAKTVTATYQKTGYVLTAKTAALYGAVQGTITSSGTDPAIACLANTGTCGGTAPNGATVTLTADVPAGSVIGSWTGCGTASADKRTCTVSMTSAKTVTANYQKAGYVLTAKTAGLYGATQGTITSTGTDPVIACVANTGTCSGTAANGATVTLTADVPAGSLLASWTGCNTVSADKLTCTVTMTGAKTVTVNYQKAGYVLTAKTAGLYGAAQGIITSAGTEPAIACAANTGVCSGTAPNGATVTLVADVPASSLLTGWTGCATVSADKRICTVAMTAAKTVTASYQSTTYLVTARTSGTGIGRIETADTEPDLLCGMGTGIWMCTGAAPNGATVTLRAIPEPGSFVSAWSGCSAVSADKTECTVAMTMARSVTATFTPTVYPITVRTAGTGRGTVSTLDTEPDLACTANAGTCSGTAPTGSTVTLTAAPEGGSVVSGWTGCTSVSADKATCTVGMTTSRYVTATFGVAVAAP
jgi:alpha-tubulin suppressor-like RCC1 family protein